MNKYNKVIELLSVIDFNSTKVDNQSHVIFNLLIENFPNTVTAESAAECNPLLRITDPQVIFANIIAVPPVYTEEVFPVAVIKYILLSVDKDKRQLLPYHEVIDYYKPMVLESLSIKV